MRHAALLLVLLAGCDPYDSVAREDTIEAYEKYLAEHGDGVNAFRANVRLEELYLQKARESGKLEDWDAYLERFPKGHHHDKALEEREESLYAWARREMTVDAWTTFVDQYPKARKRRALEGRNTIEALTYARDHMTLADVATKKVNLAEDPEGPLDGTEFSMDVTNDGDKTIKTMWMRIHYLDAEGASLGEREWPLVAPYAIWPTPIEEEHTVPMAPGQTRTWSWATGDLPDGFAGKAKILPYRVVFLDDAEE